MFGNFHLDVFSHIRLVGDIFGWSVVLTHGFDHVLSSNLTWEAIVNRCRADPWAGRATSNTRNWWKLMCQSGPSYIYIYIQICVYIYIYSFQNEVIGAVSLCIFLGSYIGSDLKHHRENRTTTKSSYLGCSSVCRPNIFTMLQMVKLPCLILKIFRFCSGRSFLIHAATATRTLQRS